MHLRTSLHHWSFRTHAETPSRQAPAGLCLAPLAHIFSEGRLDVFSLDAAQGWRLERSLNGIDGYSNQLGNSVALTGNYAVSGQVYQSNSEKAGLAIIGLPDRSFADWALLFGLTGEDSTASGDANNDGFPNRIWRSGILPSHDRTRPALSRLRISSRLCFTSTPAVEAL